MLTTIVRIAFFCLAGLALWSLDHQILGAAFVTVVALNLLVIHTGHLSPDSPTANHSVKR